MDSWSPAMPAALRQPLVERLPATPLWPGRFLVLACLMVLPYVGFLVGQGYPLARVESAAALGCLTAVAALAATVFRGRVFAAPVLVCAAAVSAVPLQRALHQVHGFSVVQITVLAGAALAGAMLLLRKDFFHLLAVFAAGAFVAHVYRSMVPPAHAAAVRAGGHRAHVLYLVLDEHMGPAGLPAGMAPCRNAAGAVELTCRSFGFRLYPYAYSNFPMTLESLPSIMNRVIPLRRGDLMHPGSPDAFGVYSVNAHRFFAWFRARNYALRVTQYRAINVAGGEGAEVAEYATRLGALAAIEGPWQEKFRLAVGTYQNSDPVLARLHAFFPFRFGPRLTGPLSLSARWPEDLLAEIASARHPTCFFVHLLTPHGPYLYRSDGSARNLGVWAGDMEDNQRLPPDVYRERYTRYAGQIEFVQSQLRRLLEGLERGGLLDGMTVVVHGDHGSRIRRLEARNVAAGRMHVDRYDYTGPPDVRDLLDRFSVLLAIKQPHQRRFSTDERRASLLRFLCEDLYHEKPPGAGGELDSVFLFDPQGNAKEVRWTHLWNPQ